MSLTTNQSTHLAAPKDQIASGLSDASSPATGRPVAEAKNTPPHAVTDSPEAEHPQIQVKAKPEVSEPRSAEAIALDQCKFGILADQIKMHALAFGDLPPPSCSARQNTEAQILPRISDRIIEKADSLPIVLDAKDEFCAALKQSDPKRYKELMLKHLEWTVEDAKELFEVLKISPVG